MKCIFNTAKNKKHRDRKSNIPSEYNIKYRWPPRDAYFSNSATQGVKYHLADSLKLFGEGGILTTAANSETVAGLLQSEINHQTSEYKDKFRGPYSPPRNKGNQEKNKDSHFPAQFAWGLVDGQPAEDEAHLGKRRLRGGARIFQYFQLYKLYHI